MISEKRKFKCKECKNELEYTIIYPHSNDIPEIEKPVLECKKCCRWYLIELMELDDNSEQLKLF